MLSIVIDYHCDTSFVRNTVCHTEIAAVRKLFDPTVISVLIKNSIFAYSRVSVRDLQLMVYQDAGSSRTAAHTIVFSLCVHRDRTR